MTAPSPTKTPPAIAIIGAELRRIVAAELSAPVSRVSRRFGDLDVELVRTGSIWRLFLADMSPIPQAACDLWAAAVGAPSVEWERDPDGCAASCKWTEAT